MNTYAYTALEPSGKRKTGFVDAQNREAAIANITTDGKFVLEIKEHEAAGSRKSTPGGRRKVNRSDLALFSRRLADLSAAGLPLDRVLQVIAEQSESADLANVAEEALEQVRRGLPVSDALAMHPKLFPDVFTQTLRAGEASGQFPQVAGRLAEFQEKEVTRRSQIISAMVYPAVLSVTSLFVVTFLLLYVVPKLSSVFDDLKKAHALPITTQLLLGFTDFLTANGLYILAGLAVAGVFYRTWSRTEAGGMARDRFLFQVPLIGPVVQKATVSRFARVLGTLVFGGVPILEAIHLAGLASGNRLFIVSSRAVENDVREGRPIADAMRDAGAFPPVLTHMVAIGEETGDLPKMLGRVSDSLDFEVDNGMRRLTAMVEPALVLIMGVIVGFVVLSILLPIFDAQSLVK